MTEISADRFSARRALYLLSVPLLLTALGCSAEPESELVIGPHPIVIIDIGTLRADRLGAWGYDRPTSPALDRLADDSVLFEWAFSPAPSTGPAQASIFTGVYPSGHGWLEDTGRLGDEAETLAEILGEQGWKTAAFVDGGFLSEGFGLEQGFDTFENLRGEGLSSVVPKAIDWLEANADETFLLVVHGYDVHAPYDPPPEARRSVLGDALPPDDFEASAQLLEQARQSATDGDAPLTELELTWASDLYDAGIRAADDQIATLIDALERLGLDQRATVIVVSDHGESFGEHGTVLHDRLYSPVTRVPLLIRLPEGRAAQRVSHPVGSVDLVPTLLDLVGIDWPESVQGQSLLPMIEGHGQPRYLAFSESPLYGGSRAVALAGYRLVETLGDGQHELFYLGDDPREQIDIAELQSEKVAVLLHQLDTWQRRITRSGDSGDAESDLDNETLEQLKNLGYIQ